VAYVGPNEAGKSTFLAALTHLNHEDSFKPEEFSRGASPAEDSEVIKATFLLEDSDLAEIAIPLSGAKPRWFVVKKLASGSIESALQPPLERNLTLRASLFQAISKTSRSKWFNKIRNEKSLELEKHEQLTTEAATRGEVLPPIRYRKGLESEVIQVLESTAQSLEEADIDTLDSLSDIWSSVDIATAKQLAIKLRNLAKLESETHPDLAARRILRSRQPEFLFFSGEDRSLASDYSLTELESWPTALQNLADLAQLDLSAFRNAVLNEDYGTAEAMTEAANRSLLDLFSGAWKQSELTVRIRDDESILRILISDEGNTYTSIAERSDGLRTFVALVAFTSRTQHLHPPILLIDEAESHLHYDAQADLVRVLTKQKSASQVIYTTHSAGCLPQDLGTGVRVIAPTETNRSEFRDAFWVEGPGFSPLLIGMGASTFALAMARRAVIAEGISEVIMLPTLLREVSGKEDLGFQIAPGLAEVNTSAVKDLQLEAPRVAYVIDGDHGGTAIRQKLIRGGVPSELVIQLGDGSEQIVLEDTIDAAVYVNAVNEELSRSHGSLHSVNETEIPPINRPSFLTRWCAERGIAAPSKPAVALRIVEGRRDGDLVASNRRRAIRTLHRALERALGFD
jgi:AAA ATPase-like protein